jgi:hypothetical protein
MRGTAIFCRSIGARALHGPDAWADARQTMKAMMAVLSLAIAACGGGQECTFTAQCQGNVLQTCDVQTRKTGPVISTEDCTQEGATCVEQGPNQASCVGNCDNTFVTHCSGSLLVYCDFTSGTGLVNAIDCYAEYADYCDPCFGCGYGGICVDNGGGNAQCQPY